MPDQNKTFLVSAEDSQKRLDIFLSEQLQITRSQAQKLIGAGLITVNGKPPKKTGDRMKTGQTLTYNTAKEKTAKTEMAAAAGISGDELQKKFKIIAETKDYLVVDKPAGLLTHPTEAGEKNSVAGLLVKKYPGLKKIGDDKNRPGIVHRLDKDASGLLVVARTQKMFDHLKEQFKNRTVKKEYLVLVHGAVERDIGKIDFPLARGSSQDRMVALPKTAKGQPQAGGKEALTEFLEEKKFVNFSLLRVKIHTGRMHQIRVHLLAYNHPVVGDPLYFNKKIKRTWDEKLGRLFLHCTTLGFTDLAGDFKEYSSPLPEPLEKFLKTLA